MLGIVSPVDLNYWNDIRLAQLQQISYVCCDGLKVDDCMPYVADLVSTPTGQALFDQVEKLAASRKVSIRIAFSNHGRTQTIRESDSSFIININCADIKGERYPYLVRHDSSGEDLGFVFVYHPPSVVLGHELGHIRQYLESGMPDTEHINEKFKSRYFELIKPVQDVFYILLKEIAPKCIPGIGMDKQKIEQLLTDFNKALENAHPLQGEVKDDKQTAYERVPIKVLDLLSDVDTLNDYLLRFYPEGQKEGPAAEPDELESWTFDEISACGLYITGEDADDAVVKRIRDMFMVFTYCFVNAWNSGQYCELPDILPVKRHAGPNDFNPTIADGIFLREIMKNVPASMSLNHTRRPAFYSSNDTTASVELPSATIEQAFLASDGPWLRWSHMSAEDWQRGPGQALKEYIEHSADAKNWFAQFVAALYTQTDVGVKMEDLPVCPPLPQWPLRDSTLWPI